MESFYEEISGISDLISVTYQLEENNVTKDVDYQELVFAIQNLLIAALYNFNIEKNKEE